MNTRSFFFIAEPIVRKKGEPSVFAHKKANKGKKSDENFNTTHNQA
jgi:hypothetical protein